MPSISWNKKVWDKTHHWNLHGDEWSTAWGNSELQWRFSIYPRIQHLLPVNSILELGPGHGRWSRFLLDNCNELALVDLSDSCIEFCRRQFGSSGNVSCYVNDGYSLEMINDGSVDFVFSFDSLVHAEDDVLECYLRQLSNKLSEDGLGFIHHSNLGSFVYFKVMRKLERVLGSGSNQGRQDDDNSEIESGNESFISEFLKKYRIVDRTHMRAITMTAEKFANLAEKNGLRCITQEAITWGQSRRPIDCLSVFTRKQSKFDCERKFRVNNEFMREAAYIRHLSEFYNTKTP